MRTHKKGYEISFDKTRNFLKLRVSGFWDVELGKKFEREFQEKIKEVHASGNGWHLLVDLTRSPPQSPEIQDIVGRAMLSAKQAGMKKKAILANWSIIVFQTANFLQEPELQVDFYFQSEDDAIRWLLNA